MKFQELGSVGQPVIEIVVDQIGKTGNLYYSKKAFKTFKHPTTMEMIKWEFNVLEFVPNVKVDENIFQLDFPNGTRVIDSELDIQYVVGVE